MLSAIFNVQIGGLCLESTPFFLKMINSIKQLTWSDLDPKFYI